MERFDDAFGWDNWSVSHRETAEGFICRIEVRIGEEATVYKEDGASRTNIEPTKGGISDAMKRCAVQFGLGRDLYKYPRVFIKGAHKYIPDHIIDRLHKMTEAIMLGEFNKPVVILE